MPVCLQAYVRGGRPIYFQAYLDTFATCSDLIAEFGDLYRPGFRFYMGSELAALDDLDSFRPTAGVFIQALPPSLPARPCIPLDDRLQEVERYFCDIEAGGALSLHECRHP